MMHTETERRLHRISLTATDVAVLVTELDAVLRAMDFTEPKFKPLYTAWLRLSESKPYKS
jgi:hypothetical protein